MKKIFSLRLVSIIIALCVITVGIFVLIQLNHKQTEQRAVSKIRQIADQYIESLVGKNEFQKNYKFKSTEHCTNVVYGCYLRYEFLPAKIYGGSEYLFYYDNGAVKIANNDISILLPSCEKDKNKCNFKVTPQQLKDIANNENISFSRLLTFNGAIVAELSYCNLETTENRKKIFIDLQNGQIVWSGPNSECQGII